MEPIPNEIWHQICSVLAKDDFMSFRLVDKRFAAIGLEHVLPNGEVTFYLTADDLDRLKAISKHPDLRHRVRCLRYEGVTLPLGDAVEFDAWKWQAEELFFGQSNTPHSDAVGKRTKLKQQSISTDADWRRHYAIYEDMLKSQDRIIQTQLDRRVLAESVFAKCPNIQKVILENEIDQRNRACWPPKHPFEDTFVDPYDHPSPQGCRQLWSLLVGSCPDRHGVLEEIVVRRLGPWFFDGHVGIELAQLRKICVSLTTLELGLVARIIDNEPINNSSGWNHADPSHPPQHLRALAERRAFAHFLSAIPNLASLKLDYDRGRHSYKYQRTENGYRAWPTEWSDTFLEGHVWPKLRSLKLECFEFTTEQLMAFLEAHKGLKTLWLTNLDNLEEPIYKSAKFYDLLLRVRDTLELNDARFSKTRWVPSSDHDISIAKYLIRRSDTLPRDLIVNEKYENMNSDDEEGTYDEESEEAFATESDSSIE
jgi:hypothetical protein